MSTPDPFQRYEEEKEEFDASPQSFAIIQQVRKQIFPQESIFIDNALCLGLGTLEDDDVHCGVERGSQLLIFETVLQTLSMYYSFSPPPPNSGIHYSRLLKFLRPLANKNRRKVYHWHCPLSGSYLHARDVSISQTERLYCGRLGHKSRKYRRRNWRRPGSKDIKIPVQLYHVLFPISIHPTSSSSNSYC